MSSRTPTHKSTLGVAAATSLSPHDPAIQLSKDELASRRTVRTSLTLAPPTSLVRTDPGVSGAAHFLVNYVAPGRESRYHAFARFTSPVRRVRIGPPTAWLAQRTGGQPHQQQQQEASVTQVVSVGKSIDQGHAQSRDPDVAGAADIDVETRLPHEVRPLATLLAYGGLGPGVLQQSCP